MVLANLFSDKGMLFAVARRPPPRKIASKVCHNEKERGGLWKKRKREGRGRLFTLSEVACLLAWPDFLPTSLFLLLLLLLLCRLSPPPPCSTLNPIYSSSFFSPNLLLSFFRTFCRVKDAEMGKRKEEREAVELGEKSGRESSKTFFFFFFAKSAAQSRATLTCNFPMQK